MDAAGMIDSPYQVHISCRDTVRSKSDMLHRFIAQLSIENYDINRVFIFEKPIRAKVVFRKSNTAPSTTRKLSGFLQQTFRKEFSEFVIYLTIQDLDAFGSNFLVHYDIENKLSETNQNYNLAEKVHRMVEAAFDNFDSISIVRNI